MDITESFRPEDLSKTDFFDFVTGPELTMNVDRSHGHTENTSDSIVEQPLQGFDQFWGPDKDTNKIESTMFEDLNRFNWNPSNAQNTNVIPNNQNANTDGQIYTITVLNGSTETWMRKDCVENPNPSLELDTILGNFSNYNVKSECFPYENTAYCNDDKDSLQIQLQQQQQQQQTQNSNDIGSQLSNITILDSNGNNTGLNGSNNVSYQCNGNLNWQMNVSEGSSSHSSESFLRSALQGKGYGKGVHGTATSQILPSIKQEDDVRQILFNNDPDSLIYGDTALTAPMFEEHSVESPGSQQATPSSTTATGVVVDDMFLSLENFSEDYEKIKRIATEVQQFCADNNNYGGVSDIINPPSAISRISNVNSASATKLNQSIHASSEITTSNSASNLHLVHNSSVNRTKPSKKYKRTTTNNNNTSISNLNNSIITTNNNNNNNQSNTNSNNATASPVHLNGQRKERSLHYCSICSKGFKDKYSVNVHIRTHTGEKPFACSLCGKSFRQKAHLAKHYQTHLAQKNGSGNMKNKGGNHQNPRSTQTPSSTLQNTPQSQAPLQIQLNQTPILITTPGQVTVVASR